MTRYSNAANAAPIIGPNTGTHAYSALNDALSLMGTNECTMRGPKSLAGLIAYPVVPPNESPIAQTRKATGNAPIEPKPIGVVESKVASLKCRMVKIRTKVASVSLSKLRGKFLIAGEVQNTACLAPASSVWSK